MVGDSPLLMSEELVKGIKIVSQRDSGFGVDARAGPGDLSSPEALLEHLPPDQNPSVLLFCAFHQLF